MPDRRLTVVIDDTPYDVFLRDPSFAEWKTAAGHPEGDKRTAFQYEEDLFLAGVEAVDEAPAQAALEELPYRVISAIVNDVADFFGREARETRSGKASEPTSEPSAA